MAFAVPTPDHLPCPDCGALVPVGADADVHVCDDEQRIEYQLRELKPDVDRFSDDFGDWLNTPEGRLQQWIAERER
jgi:hypothetical protein